MSELSRHIAICGGRLDYLVAAPALVTRADRDLRRAALGQEPA